MKKLFLVLLSCSWALRVFAVTPVPYTLGLGFSFQVSGVGGGIMTVYGETSSPSTSQTASGPLIESPVSNLVWLKPNKEYTVYFQASGVVNSWLSFVAPQGYQLYIDDVPQDLLHTIWTGSLAAYNYTHTIVLRPMMDSSRADAGTFSGINVAKNVSWNIGLGGIRSGHSIGRLGFVEPDLSDAPASRQHLLFTPQSNAGQCTVVRDSSLALQQISVPQCVINLVDDSSGGYWINFYKPVDSHWTGSLYTFSAGAWKQFRVEEPAANQLKITEIEGSVSHVSLLSLSSAPVLASGGATSSRGGYIVHKFMGSGTFTVNAVTSPLTSISAVDVLAVGGGGGGGASLSGTMNGGGGGGGGVNYSTGVSVSTTSYTVTVGTGGTSGMSGGNSVFASVTGYGGGHGASGAYGASGASGGCGGGEGTAQGGGPGAQLYGQGGYGANGAGAPNYEGGGGGGAGSTAHSIDGAIGAPSSISGMLMTYGGGGGAGTNALIGGGEGTGGGGAGGGSTSPSGGNGYPNTGGGGGGGGNSSSAAGGTGGSGILFIRYPAPSAGGVTTGTFTWKLEEGDGTTVFRTTTHNSTKVSTTRTDIVDVYNGSSFSPDTETEYDYSDYAWGEELVKIIQDPATNMLTQQFAYYTTNTDAGEYRRIQALTDSTGNWTAYSYYNTWDQRGQVENEFHPYCNLPSLASGASTSAGRVIHFNYSADWTERFTRPSLMQETVNSATVVTAKKVLSNSPPTTLGTRDIADILSYRDSSHSQADHTETIRSDSVEEAGEPALIQSANLTQTVWSRAPGSYTGGGSITIFSGGQNWREITVYGSTSPTGASESSWDSQTFDATNVIPNQSTMTVVIRDAAGNIIHTETRVYVGSSTWTVLTTEDRTYDFAGRLTQRVSNSGVLLDNAYVNGRLDHTVDAAGTEIDFSYDALGRVRTSAKVFPSSTTYSAPTTNIITTCTYDGANHVTQTVVSGGGLTQTSSSFYDKAGRLTSTTAPGSYITSYAYSSGGKIVTATLPGLATKITEIFLDGQLKSVTGTGVVAENYLPFIDTATGKKAVQSYFGGNVSALTNTYSDWLGRKIEEWKIGWDGYYHAHVWSYNDQDQLAKFSQPGVADTLYSYDALGVQTMSALDVNGNGTIDLASDDRITQQNHTIVNYGSVWYQRMDNYTYATSGSGTPTWTGATLQMLNVPTGTLDATYTYDRYMNYTYQTSYVNRSNHTLISCFYRTDSTASAYEVAYNGLTVSTIDNTNLTKTYGYDGLGRQITSTDPRKGTTTTVYLSGTNQIDHVVDPDISGTHYNDAEYTYDSAGRVESVKNALGKFCHYKYTDRNEKLRVWGDTDDPVEYSYDGSGHMTSMSTFRGSTGWSAGIGATTGADTTTWAYDGATNLLASKTDAAGKVVSYTYTVAQQIATRLWARVLTGTTHLTTSYSYSGTTGELTGVSYNDGTPTLAYTYNRLGENATVGDYAGTRTFTYNLGTTLELASETLPSFYGSRKVTYGYDTINAGTLGRPISLALYNLGSSTTEQSTTYGYNGFGQINSVAGGGQTFAYGYAANSHLVATVSDLALGYTDARTYNSAHDWISDRKTTISSAVRAEFAYTPDSLGRITQVAKTSDANGVYDQYGAAGLTTYYGYDDKSQVTSEVTKLGTGSTLLPGRNDSAYVYDSIGNRTSRTHNGTSTSYTSNSVNQYIARDVAGTFDVAGMGLSGTTITVSRTGGATDTAARQGLYFYDGYAVGNTSSAFYDTLNVVEGSTTTHLTAYVAKTPEFTSTSHDDDGNLIADGRWNYGYDAENRLTVMQTIGSATAAGAPLQYFGFYYDYLGRRVLKISYLYVGGTWVYQTQERYVYNGWNLIAVLDNAPSLLRNHFWGLDISGPGQTAGGVGALLLTQDASNSYLPIYDGNGNVHGMITIGSVTLSGHAYSGGDLVAGYEYDAFGNTLRESGGYAESNPFRFSTKFTDVETSLVYYGTRYYSPSIGRFINRDTIEEQGGMNLYAFVSNNGVNSYDILGREDGLWGPNPNGGINWVSLDGMDSQDRYNASMASAVPSFEQMAQQSMASALTNATTTMAINLATGTAEQKQDAANWFGSDASGISIAGSLKSGAITISDKNNDILFQAAVDHTTGAWSNIAPDRSSAIAGVMAGMVTTTTGTSSGVGNATVAQALSNAGISEAGIGSSLARTGVLGISAAFLTLASGDSTAASRGETKPYTPLTVYRVWGGASRPFGHSWTTVDPRVEAANYRDLAGLPNANTGQYLSIGTLYDPRGTILMPAQPLDEGLGGTTGGWPEIWVPNPQIQIELTEPRIILPPPINRTWIKGTK